MFVYLDHAFISEEEAKISCFDRGFLLGDGVYATLKVENGSPLFLERHLERLSTQSRNFGIDPREISEEIIYELIDRNQAYEGIYKLKIVCTAGLNPDMALPKSRKGSLFIFMKPFQPLPYAPLNLILYPQTLITAHATFKSLAHLSRYVVAQYAKENGYDDALTTAEEGIVLEASFANLFWMYRGEFFTPDHELPLHFGVTISEITALMRALGIKTHFVKMQLQNIPQEAFLFRANTMSGIRPIISINGRNFGRNSALEEFLLKNYVERCDTKKARVEPSLL